MLGERLDDGTPQLDDRFAGSGRGDGYEPAEPGRREGIDDRERTK